MTTVLQDQTTMIGTHVDTAWPGTNSPTGYWDATEGTPVSVTALPQPPDYLLFWVIKTILETRQPDAMAKFDMSNAERKDLWTDVINRLTKGADYVTAVIDALTTVRDALP